MNISDLADVARRRGVRRILYFHTDHFEPWSLGITDDTVRAMDQFRELSRKSPYGCKQSLFYLTHNAHTLRDGDDPTVVGPPGDRVGFHNHAHQSPETRKRMIDAIRPLVTEDGHEMHLHVHHERWTMNTLQTDSSVWHWVQEHSSPEQDEARFSAFIGVALDTIAQEVGFPLDRWAFVHGNWALNGSDDEICRIDAEMDLLMRAGCYGDFTFPAGRAHCDPAMERPFTCLPIHVAKGYSEAQSEPIGIDFGSKAFADERFFIWNSRIKAGNSSIDWYYEPNLEKFRHQDQLVGSWLDESVVFGDTLFLKTHAHSVNYRYELWRDDRPIPHTHPAVVGAFDHLMRVCDDAKIEFRPHSANEIISILRAIDSERDDPSVIDRALAEVERARETRSTAMREQQAAPAASNSAVNLDGGGGTIAAAARSLGEFTFPGSGALTSRPYGSVFKEHCPICGSKETISLWKIPMTRLDPPAVLFGGYFDMVPTLQTPFQIFGFDACQVCETIFLNPDIPRQQLIDSYIRSTSYVDKMANQAEWAGYEERYRNILKFAPENANILVDCGCGYGQVLFLARKDEAHPWTRAVGLELSEAYVKNMRENGIEAHQFDLDRDDHRAIVAPGSADFVAFHEAFEHVERPLGALARMLDMLRPGGRLYFTAQRYGSDVKLAIRPGEPIYIGPRVVELFDQMLPCRTIDVVANGSRYFVVLERTEAPIEEKHLRLGMGDSTEPPMLLQPGRAAEAAPAGVHKDGDAGAVTLEPPFDHNSGYCYVARLGALAGRETLAAMADDAANPRRSRATLLEDGRVLGPAHSVHAYVAKVGKGSFSHWSTNLYFSSSDGSDPNTNGRRYVLQYRTDAGA
jgi:SAM-dependent methyltransferase